MNIIAIDDERLALESLVYSIKKAVPDADVDSFQDPEDAIKAAEQKIYDVVFTDIQIPRMTGIAIAKAMKARNPKVNIIFVTGYSEYMDAAIRLHASGYLKKPITAVDVTEELDNLIHPVENDKGKIYIQTFGNFCLFVDGKPVVFKRGRSEEMLAYLVDRRGAAISRKELAGILFEDSDFSRAEQVYMTTIAHDLEKNLNEIGAKGLFVKGGGKYSVNTTKFTCDSYDYLEGDPSAMNRFGGEYMEQYSWAEYLKGKFYDDRQ